MPSPPSPQSGVLPAQELRRLMEQGVIIDADTHASGCQPASIDLSLGERAYRLQSSFLPQNSSVREGMRDLVMYELPLGDGAILEKGAVYLIPLRERLKLPKTLLGKTNPKSSTGRLDVFTRVITDHCRRFEEVAPGYEGELFLEVVPRSFTIKVRAGERLNQLRLFTLGRDEEEMAEPFAHDFLSRLQFLTGAELQRLYGEEKLLFDLNDTFIGQSGKHIAADGLLMGIGLCSSDGVVGYKSKKNSQVIDLEMIGKYRAEDFWETISEPPNGKLILEPEDFYIFASKERIRIPLGYASEMVEFDAGSGELRTHYAGFFDPGFGYGRAGEVKGTKAVLEVRPHDVPFIVEDGQILFKMKYEPMAEPPEIYYGEKTLGSNYHDQTLKLSKLFK